MIRFILAPHKVRTDGAGVVEIREDDRLLGVLYPGDGGSTEARAVRLLSRLIDDREAVVEGDGLTGFMVRFR